MKRARKKILKPSLPQTSHGMVGRFACWWNKTSFAGRITLVTGLIIGITGSIVGLSHALPIVEPYWYVAQYELRLVQSQQAAATDRQTLFQLQQFLANALKDPNAARSSAAQDYIASLRKQIDETQKRVDKSEQKK